MKKLFTLVLFTLFSFSIYSQIGYQYVFQEPHGVVQAIDVNKDSFLVATGSSKSCPEGFVAYFNSLGTIFWKKSLNEYLSPATDVFFDYQNNIIAAGTKSGGDDIGSPKDGIYILKLDAIGNTIFYKRFIKRQFLLQKVHAIQLPDSTYLAGVTNHLFWASVNGDSLRTKELTIDKMIGLSIVSDSTVLILSKKKAIIINLKGDIITEIPTQEDFIATCNKKDTTWILGTQNVWTFTTNNSTPQLYPLQNLTSPQGITPRQNGKGVTIWGRNERSTNFLNFTNGVWERINISYRIGSNLVDVKNIRKKYYFAGSDSWEDMPRGNVMHGGFVSAMTEGIAFTTEITSDIGIENVTLQVASRLDTIDRIRVADTLHAFGLGGQFSGVIEVVNRSAYDVNKFVLSSSQRGGFNCAEGRLFFSVIDSVNIKPYETKKINVKFYDYFYFYTAGGSLNTDRCFFVAAPNHFFDQYRANNSFCTNILTSTNQVILPETSILVFPNPATSTIQIQAENNISIESLQLFNIAGQLQNVTTDIHFNQATLHRGNLPAGLYGLKIQMKEGFVIKKVVFQ